MRSPPAASAVRLDMETGKIYYESQSRPSSLKLQRQQSKAARRPRSAQRDKTRGLPEAAKTTGHGATSSRSPPPPRWLSLSNVRHAPSSEERWTASSAAEQERRVWRTLLGNFVASPAIGDAQRALTKWLRREPPWLAAAAVAHEAARLAFHEDVVLLRCGTAAAAEGFSRQSLEVTVGLGLVDHRAGVGSIAVRCGGAETVRGLVVAATTKYAQIFGDAERFAGLDVDNCIFKVVGRAEYLIHGAWRLADYRCVANARHDRRRLKLELLELDARAKAALANVRALSTDDFNLLTHRARSPKGDYYSHHLPPSRKKKTKKTKHVVAGVALGVSVTADRSVSDRGTKLAGYLARRLAEHRDDMERIWSAIDDHQLFDDDDDDDLDDEALDDDDDNDDEVKREVAELAEEAAEASRASRGSRDVKDHKEKRRRAAGEDLKAKRREVDKPEDDDQPGPTDVDVMLKHAADLQRALDANDEAALGDLLVAIAPVVVTTDSLKGSRLGEVMNKVKKSATKGSFANADIKMLSTSLVAKWKKVVRGDR